MTAISLSRYISSYLASPSSLSPITISRFPTSRPSLIWKYPSSTKLVSSRKTWVFAKSSEEAGVAAAEDEWLKRLPEKNKPLYAHSLPCVEAWLKQFGFRQSKDDRAVWFIERSDWHAQLSLETTDLYIRYLKSGPGNLDKDVERRFSYALSREDIENAILGGP